ncbi:hypothetical protein [Streptomyces abyssomicinicus]|uniref:hypothetical protein n=1 Tax=Streptomyces abyssomicinicus TaxID=574929 RepID=UPI00124F929F|nr:hypothetical protein [Streptomyces abyssomicinicus]
MAENATPPFAQLFSGVTVGKIRDVISKSGYPFQAVIAEVFRESSLRDAGQLEIQEEWAYVDRESGETRSVDLFVNTVFRHGYEHPESKIRASLSLVVECKQSELPYIFFLRHSPPTSRSTFPEFGGLNSTDIRVFPEGELGGIRQNEDFSIWMSASDALALHELPFFNAPAPYAISLAKAVRRGAKLELTGEEAYRGITLPLLKAADHLHSLNQPQPNSVLVFPKIIVNLAVVRAPMVGTFLHAGEQELMALPWVRVGHLEPTLPDQLDRQRARITGNVRYFDVVHESFLPRYLEVLARDATSAAERLHLHSTEIAAGVAMSDFAEGHEGLKPLPENHGLDLEKPCHMHIGRSPNALSISVTKTGGEISDSESSAVVGWIDGYPWLDRPSGDD